MTSMPPRLPTVPQGWSSSGQVAKSEVRAWLDDHSSSMIKYHTDMIKKHEAELAYWKKVNEDAKGSNEFKVSVTPSNPRPTSSSSNNSSSKPTPVASTKASPPSSSPSSSSRGGGASPTSKVDALKKGLGNSLGSIFGGMGTPPSRSKPGRSSSTPLEAEIAEEEDRSKSPVLEHNKILSRPKVTRHKRNPSGRRGQFHALEAHNEAASKPVVSGGSSSGEEKDGEGEKESGSDPTSSSSSSSSAFKPVKPKPAVPSSKKPTPPASSKPVVSDKPKPPVPATTKKPTPPVSSKPKPGSGDGKGAAGAKKVPPPVPPVKKELRHPDKKDDESEKEKEKESEKEKKPTTTAATPSSTKPKVSGLGPKMIPTDAKKPVGKKAPAPSPSSSSSGIPNKCGECGCTDFSQNAFKKGSCNNCFHKH